MYVGEDAGLQGAVCRGQYAGASDVWSLEKFLQDDVSKGVTMCVARNSRLHSTARIDLSFHMFSELFICSFLHVSNGSFAYDFRCFLYLGQRLSRRAPH